MTCHLCKQFKCNITTMCWELVILLPCKQLLWRWGPDLWLFAISWFLQSDFVASRQQSNWSRTESVCISLLSVCYQFAVKWGQAGNYIQSVCDNMAIICDKSAKTANLSLSAANLLPSVNKEIQIWDRISEPNSNIVPARQQFNCKKL